MGDQQLLFLIAMLIFWFLPGSKQRNLRSHGPGLRGSPAYGFSFRLRSRVTITEGIEIGRLPGIVHISMLTPVCRLEQTGIAHFVKEQYGLSQVLDSKKTIKLYQTVAG